MRRVDADISRPTDAPSLASSPAASTALDRLLDLSQQAGHALARASDLAVVAIASVLAGADALVWATDPVVDTGRWSISLAFLVPCLGGVATVAVAMRRRHLSAGLLALAVASAGLSLTSWAIGSSLPPSLAALFALALLTSIALRREAGGSAVALAAAGGLATAAEALRPMVADAGYLLVACEGAFAAAVGVGIYLRWTDWRRAAAAESARADERVEIAREVHDMAGHYVTAMVVQAQAAQHVAPRQPHAAAEALAGIERAGNEALIAMHQLVSGLRTNSSTTPTGTWDDVDRLIDAARAQGQPVHAAIDADVRRAAPTLAPAVHRIISESLTNVRRHARGVTRVDIELSVERDGVLVSVRDDGSPAAATVHGGFGVIGMGERAAATGGTLTAGPTAAGGWAVRAMLPIAHVP